MSAGRAMYEREVVRRIPSHPPRRSESRYEMARRRCHAPGPAQEVATPMQDAPYRLISLRNRRGRVIAEAVVDEVDFPEVGRHRWHRTYWGYVARSPTRAERRCGAHNILLHRQLMGLLPPSPEPIDWFWSGTPNVNPRGVEVDHRNGDKLDNRRANLRIATRVENAQNIRAPGGTSSQRGVSWHAHTRTWQVSFHHNGRRVHLGYHPSHDAAVAVAKGWITEHLPHIGEHAR